MILYQPHPQGHEFIFSHLTTDMAGLNSTEELLEHYLLV
jgi:hypothetical protein